MNTPIKCRTKREFKIATEAWNNGHTACNNARILEIDKLKAEVVTLKQREADNDARLKILNSIGQSFEALSRAICAIEKY